MVNADYRRALKGAEREMVRLMAEKERITRRIAETKRAIIALRTATEIDGKEHVRLLVPRTLTDAVGFEFQLAKRPLQPLDVKNRILATGFVPKASNVGASVHSVVKRLVQQGHLLKVYPVHPSLGFNPFDTHYWWAEYPDIPSGWVNPTDAELRHEIRKHFDKARTRKERKK